ncbi:MAG TPA: hypothetical protein VFI24_16260 [Pyrinomonadaceae bacterium]|nr:hypothetical protein [Pyrinomonadaceae bacterium]
MVSKLVSSLFLAACLATSAAASGPSQVVARFGGECEGQSFQLSEKLASLISRIKSRERNRCDSEFCHGVFAYDLNADGSKEYFVRLSCGATGNCLWGIFSDRPARLRGTFTAWFFYIHRRTSSWNALSTYTREGGDQGVIARLRNRRGQYMQISERTEHGYDGNHQPFLRRMGIPKCS